MLEFAVLSSGSKANCLYIGNDQERILIDCGLSAKQACLRLQAVGIEPDTISSIIVTHEHSDHIAGIPVFQKRFKSRIYVNSATLTSCPSLSILAPDYLTRFDTSKEFTIGTLSITPISILHDASDPVGFRISSGDATLALITDLGQVTNLVKEKTRDVDALILECNHEVEMLWEAPYPWELKQRIRSRFGHLSNEQAAEFLEENFTQGPLAPKGADAEATTETNPELPLSQQIETITEPRSKSLPRTRLRYVIAGHISEKSNHPDVATHRLKEVGSKLARISQTTPSRAGQESAKYESAQILSAIDTGNRDVFEKCGPATAASSGETVDELKVIAAGPYEPLPLIRI